MYMSKLSIAIRAHDTLSGTWRAAWITEIESELLLLLLLRIRDLQSNACAYSNTAACHCRCLVARYVMSLSRSRWSADEEEKRKRESSCLSDVHCVAATGALVSGSLVGKRTSQESTRPTQHIPLFVFTSCKSQIEYADTKLFAGFD